MFMAIWIAENWRDKYNMIFVFANTGAEHPLTLKFVDMISYVWSINIVWVEADVHPLKGVGTDFRVVTYETASRNYEPFDAVVNKYGVANKSYPHCNRELKLAPIHKYAMSIFGGNQFELYDTAIGIRADEVDRIQKNAVQDNLIYPLIGDHPMTKQEVVDWWKGQVYDLEIPEHYGNCLTCFKKSDRKLATISIEKPEWFDKQRGWEVRSSLIGSKDGRPRYIYRSNKSVDDIFAISKGEKFELYTDGNFTGSTLEIDVDEPCAHDCAST